MILYLIRHTTPNIEKGICYGQADIDVANNFEDEAQFLLNKLTNINPSKVISSPLQRCTKLAHKINPNYTTNPNLKELNFGNWELKEWNNIPQEEIDPWYADFVHTPVTNGESYMDLYLRAISMYNNCTKNNTFLVTHSGFIRSILAYITKTNLQDSFNFKIPYGTIVKVDTELNEYVIL